MPDTEVTLVGLGAMGRALAGALLASGRTVTTWNRTPGRETDLVARGARAQADLVTAIAASPTVVVCLYDHASVVEALDPVAGQLRGRTLVNLTTTSPDEARNLAGWATAHGISYLDGAIMAVPAMIGQYDAAILYSGSAEAFEVLRPLLDVWATSTFDGADPGLASLYDLAMLSAMYSMLAGFLHGAAMIRQAGLSATGYAQRAAPFLAAMTGALEASGIAVDAESPDDPQQSLTWTREVLHTIARAATEVSVDPSLPNLLTSMVDDQIRRGRGGDGLERIVDSYRTPRTGVAT